MFRTLLTLILLACGVCAMAADVERIVKQVQFPPGRTSTTLQGSVKGYQTIAYRVTAAAGQTLEINFSSSHRSSYFNLLPPGSSNVAMVMGEFNDNRFKGLLPDDGVYTIQVFLMRSAARRNEVGQFTLSVGVSGAPLKPLAAGVDARLPGTRYHASTTAACEPAYTRTRECQALVVRRGQDGTATVELRWDKNSRRRILFVQGEPRASDAAQAMTFTRDERGWRITFGGEEHFDVPQPLVFGG